MSWREAAASLFGGEGSFGNGGAMRVAPLGAYFADDLERVVEEARRSALVTHAHPEGQAGAIAIAVAAAVAWQTRELELDAARTRLWDEVLERTPSGLTHAGIERARGLAATTPIEQVVEQLGNGSGVSSQDTVPLCMWAIAEHLRDYERALWTTVAALGDRDTTCAIVGGVVVLGCAGDPIPADWLARREALV
jgi:ADP-ribosylglycohydrolase